VFFALWPDDAIRDQLEHAVRKTVRASGGAAVPAQNLHITLAFLGAVDPAALSRARAAAGAVVAPPLAVQLDRIEAWPRQKLLCLVPSQPNEPLRQLVRTLKAELEIRGFELERRAWRPHLTLARKLGRFDVAENLALPDWPIEDFALVESRTDPRGSQYTVLERWALGGH
jgi:2'-5' RNA ligase